MSTSYGATPPGITGTHYGGAGLGLAGSLIPSEGLDGPGYLYAGLSLPDDAAREIRGPITRWPAGTLTVFEDSSFHYTGPTDYALFRVYVDGVALTDDIGNGPGIGLIFLGVGAEQPTLSGTAALDDIQPGGALETIAASQLAGGAALDDLTAAGSLASLAPGESELSGGATLADATPGGGLFSLATQPTATPGFTARRAPWDFTARRARPVFAATIDGPKRRA
jgi:hypothetical protein